MRKILALLLSAILIFALCACTGTKEEGVDVLNPYFTGKVLEKHEKSCLLEVTDGGNQSFAAGTLISVSTDVANCPDFDEGDLLTVSFDGTAAESYPMQIFNVYLIAKTEAPTGK